MTLWKTKKLKAAQQISKKYLFDDLILPTQLWQTKVKVLHTVDGVATTISYAWIKEGNCFFMHWLQLSIRGNRFYVSFAVYFWTFAERS